LERLCLLPKSVNMAPTKRTASPAPKKAADAGASKQADEKNATGTMAAKLKRNLPLLLWPPNVIGYVRVITLVLAMLEPEPTSNFAIWMVTASLVLDYFDGPCARQMDMCSQFGDLLDHYTDHATMMWLVWVATQGSSHPVSYANLTVSAVHNGVAFVYMAVYGHYFKHSERGNMVTRNIEANNYWNLPSMLYCANCILLPLMKLSLAQTHGMKPYATTTRLIEVADALGAGVTLSYSFAVWF